MFLGVFKEEYKGKVKVFNYEPIVVHDIQLECINHRNEDFSYLYNWYILSVDKLEKVSL